MSTEANTSYQTSFSSKTAGDTERAIRHTHDNTSHLDTYPSLYLVGRTLSDTHTQTLSTQFSYYLLHELNPRDQPVLAGQR